MERQNFGIPEPPPFIPPIKEVQNTSTFTNNSSSLQKRLCSNKLAKQSDNINEPNQNSTNETQDDSNKINELTKERLEQSKLVLKPSNLVHKALTTIVAIDCEMVIVKGGERK